jgi:hypothetical protein
MKSIKTSELERGNIITFDLRLEGRKSYEVLKVIKKDCLVICKERGGDNILPFFTDDRDDCILLHVKSLVQP